MQCIILAAGRGTRMLRLTDDTPKPLLKFSTKNGSVSLASSSSERVSQKKNSSILDWTLENLPLDINEAIFVVGYLENSVRKFIQSKKLKLKTTFIDQKILNGTGGALALCKSILKDRFLVINGDDLYKQEDLARLMAHKNLAILGSWSKSWKGAGLLVDENGYLAGLEGNPPPQEEKIANTGAYLLDERFFNYPMATIKHGKEFSIPHTLVGISHDHKIFVERATFWKQINTPNDLKV